MAKTKLGKVSICPRGTYSASVTYEPLDLVTYEGVSFISRVENAGVAPADGDRWQKLADGTQEDAYELIDTISVESDTSVVSRSKEPDGTAYNFKKVMIVADLAATSTYSANLAIYYFYNKDYSGCIQSWLITPYSTTRVSRGFSRIMQDGGFWLNENWKCVSGSGDTGVRYDSPYYAGRYPATKGQGITSILIKDGISAGTIIKIYAVRA